MSSSREMWFSPRDIGIIGVSLYGVVSLIALQRVFINFYPYRPPFFSTRKMFHVLLTIYGALQALSFCSFIRGENNYNKWTYCSHLFGIFSEISAFSLVSILWSKTLMSRNNAKKCVIPFLIFVDSIFLLYIVYLVIDMSFSPDSFVVWSQSSFIFREILVVEPAILIINSILITYLGVRITQRITAHPSWSTIDPKHKKSILMRLLGTMFTCCSCFCIRAILELYLWLRDAKGIDYDEWWILSTWVPTIIPALVLMYTMRRSESSRRKKRSLIRKLPKGTTSKLRMDPRFDPQVVETQEYYEEDDGYHYTHDEYDGYVSNPIAPLLSSSSGSNFHDDLEDLDDEKMVIFDSTENLTPGFISAVYEHTRDSYENQALDPVV